jgi:hypothetical protein
MGPVVEALQQHQQVLQLCIKYIVDVPTLVRNSTCGYEHLRQIDDYVEQQLPSLLEATVWKGLKSLHALRYNTYEMQKRSISVSDQFEWLLCTEAEGPPLLLLLLLLLPPLPPLPPLLLLLEPRAKTFLGGSVFTAKSAMNFATPLEQLHGSRSLLHPMQGVYL